MTHCKHSAILIVEIVPYITLLSHQPDIDANILTCPWWCHTSHTVWQEQWLDFTFSHISLVNLWNIIKILHCW